MATEFKFEDWLAEYELTQATKDSLVKAGFNSEMSLKMLTPDIIKTEKELKKLTTGQFLLLGKAAESLRPVTEQRKPQDGGLQDGGYRPLQQAQTNGTVTDGGGHDRDPDGRLPGSAGPELLGAAAEAASSVAAAGSAAAPDPRQQLQNKLDAGSSLSATDIMSLLQPERGEVTARGARLPPGKNSFDPLGFTCANLTDQAAKLKWRDIRDYVSVTNKMSYPNDPSGTVKIGNVELSIKDKKIAIEGLSMSQYMEASLRIMRDMVSEDGADMATIMQYAGYLIKISHLAQAFRWDSVLRYDHAYRKHQAEMGFNWGADSSYLMQLYLKINQPQEPRSETAMAQRLSAQARARPGQLPRLAGRNRFDPASGQVICQRYNGKQGCSLRGCKFAHVCITCYANHPDHAHRNLENNESQ